LKGFRGNLFVDEEEGSRRAGYLRRDNARFFVSSIGRVYDKEVDQWGQSFSIDLLAEFERQVKEREPASATTRLEQSGKVGQEDYKPATIIIPRVLRSHKLLSMMNCC